MTTSTTSTTTTCSTTTVVPTNGGNGTITTGAIQTTQPVTIANLFDRFCVSIVEIYDDTCLCMNSIFSKNTSIIPITETERAISITKSDNNFFEKKDSDAVAQIKRKTAQIKRQTTIEQFNQKVYEDIVDSFVSHPVESITIDSFTKQVKLLSSLFPNNSIVDIETSLRQALLAIKGNANRFIELQYVYTNDDAAPRSTIAHFYGELAKPVTAQNKHVRSNALHRIIG